MQSNFIDWRISVSDPSTLQQAVQTRFKSISVGFKLIVVCGLAVLMLIPALFVADMLRERRNRADDVTREISRSVGGKQTFLGPTLAIPYDVPPQSQTDHTRHGTYFVFPAQALATVKTDTEERHRSLFRVPVFKSDLKLDAAFDLTGVPAAAPQGALLDWSRAEIVVGVTDARGALADALLTVNGKTTTMIPAQNSEHIPLGSDQGHEVNLTLFGAKAGAIAQAGAQFSVSASLKFSGAQRIAILSYGKTTRVTAQGDWPSPGFDGGFSPVSRSVVSNGFTAEWSVPFIARGVRAEGSAETITGLQATDLGISFVELADPYQSVDRALKYVPLFMGLVFLSYFIFEITSGKRVHPAQYILVGFAQIIFYLLLLSLAERVGFDFGFLAAGGATVILLSINAGWIFASRAHGLRALAVFSMLYGLIYMLLRLEDNALLVGAVASFLAVAAAMYFTRLVDWYSSNPPGTKQTESAPLSTDSHRISEI
jgi:inner membrane protein